MSRTVVVVLAVLAGASVSRAYADPPTPKVPAETRASADQKSPEAATQPNSSTPAAAATPAVAADSAQAAKPAASSSDQSQREALLLDQGYKPAMRNGEKVFCKREVPMGSRLPSALHCLTTDEADLIAKEGREATERIQRNTVGCLGAAAGGCGK